MGLMNIMQVMKHFSGCRGTQKKNKAWACFFSFSSVKRAFWGSFSFIKFINWAGERRMAVSIAYLMNIMQIYEGGVFMAIFGKAVLYGSAIPLLWAGFMNLGNRRTSLNFINWEG
jgi:hypothetical protein